jgi:DnaJ-class molecular chaperone
MAKKPPEPRLDRIVRRAQSAIEEAVVGPETTEEKHKAIKRIERYAHVVSGKHGPPCEHCKGSGKSDFLIYVPSEDAKTYAPCIWCNGSGREVIV